MAGGGAANTMTANSVLWFNIWVVEMNLILQSALSGPSPYNDSFAYNPESDLDAALTQWDALDIAVDAYSVSLWSTQVSTASSALSGTVYPTSTITTEVGAFETNQTARLAQAIGRLAAGMSDAGSALTSAFVLGVAQMEIELAKNSDQYEAQLRRERQQMLYQGIIAGTGQLVGMLNYRIEALDTNQKARAELARMTISSQTARLQQELYIDAQNALWDIGLFSYAGNLIASWSGGVAAASGIPTAAQSAVSNVTGALSALGPLIAAL